MVLWRAVRGGGRDALTAALPFADGPGAGLRHGGGWDVDLIADAYREAMGDRLDSLSGAKLEKSWKGFCEAFFARRGRPS